MKSATMVVAVLGVLSCGPGPSSADGGGVYTSPEDQCIQTCSGCCVGSVCQPGNTDAMCGFVLHTNSGETRAEVCQTCVSPASCQLVTYTYNGSNLSKQVCK